MSPQQFLELLIKGFFSISIRRTWDEEKELELLSSIHKEFPIGLFCISPQNKQSCFLDCFQRAFIIWIAFFGNLFFLTLEGKFVKTSESQENWMPLNVCFDIFLFMKFMSKISNKEEIKTYNEFVRKVQKYKIITVSCSIENGLEIHKALNSLQ